MSAYLLTKIDFINFNSSIDTVDNMQGYVHVKIGSILSTIKTMLRNNDGQKIK